MSGRPRKRTARPRRWRRRLLLGLAALVLVPALPVAALRWLDPPTSAFMLQRQWQTRADPNYAIRWHWVDLDRISPWLAIAVVAAEDQKFPHHVGFDFQSLRSALEDSRAGSRLRGASTISQQTAKNLLLWSGRSYLRKGLEAWFTAWLEATLPKRRILEIYLNVAEFGDGIYGAEAAARHYFGKPAAALGRREAALLAAILPNPRGYRIVPPEPYIERRVRWIETQIGQLGGIRYLDPLQPDR